MRHSEKVASMLSQRLTQKLSTAQLGKAIIMVCVKDIATFYRTVTSNLLFVSSKVYPPADETHNIRGLLLCLSLMDSRFAHFSSNTLLISLLSLYLKFDFLVYSTNGKILTIL